MKQKLNQLTDELKAEIYEEYLNGKSIIALKTQYKITQANIRTCIVKGMCAGADLNVIERQEDLAF